MSPTLLGIYDVRPGAFSDGDVIMRVEQMLAEGADMIDVQSESARASSGSLSADEELDLVLPVVRVAASLAPVCIDTRHEAVARAAVGAGAAVVSDVGANLASVAAELGAGWIAVHDQGDFGGDAERMAAALTAKAAEARDLGVEQVWIDPGFGFEKNLEHGLRLLANLNHLVATGWPVAVGTSRKSMIGQLLARSDGVSEPVSADDRLVGSIATATYALTSGVELIRAHDVKATRQALSVVTGRSPAQSRS